MVFIAVGCPVAPNMLMGNHFALFGMVRITLADALFLGRITVHRLPLTPVVTKGRNFLGIGLCVQFTGRVCHTSIGHCARLQAGRRCCYNTFIINAFGLPFTGFTGKIIAASVMTSDPFAINFLIAVVPVRPIMLRIFNGAEAFCAVNHMMNAVAGISPIIGVISAGFFTGVILVIFTAAIRTGDPVS